MTQYKVMQQALDALLDVRDSCEEPFKTGCAIEALTTALAQPVIVPTQFQVLAITTAYEQGVGKGQQGVNFNPYKTGYCADAWAMGFDQGQNHALPSGVSRG